MSEVKVSIVLPAYNAEKYLSKAISSILNQTFKNIELIVINDGSSDRTEEIIHSFKDNRLVYVKNQINLGLIQTLNNGFSLATGDYIARMDADDIAHPDRLKTQVKFLESLNHPAIVGSNIIIINNDEKIIKVPRKVHLSKEENFWIKYRKTPLQHPTVMMSCEIARKFIPFYQSQDVHMEDYAAWLRVNSQYPIYNINEPLLFYRMHDTNITKIHNSSQTQNMVNFLKKYYAETLGDQSKHNFIKNLIYLKIESNENTQNVFQEILENAQLFITKYGTNNLVLTDVAYSILNIGLKSGLSRTLEANMFILSKLGLKPWLMALSFTGQEALRSIVCKVYYQMKYRQFLKDKI